MITKQQRKALLFIEAELDRTGGVAPTVREIADHFDYRSTTMARRLLKGLEDRPTEVVCWYDAKVLRWSVHASADYRRGRFKS